MIVIMFSPDKLSEQKQNERDIKDALKQKRTEEKDLKHEASVGGLLCQRPFRLPTALVTFI